LKYEDFERIKKHLKHMRWWRLGTRSEERSIRSQRLHQKRNSVQKHLKDWRLWRCQASEGHINIKRHWLILSSSEERSLSNFG